MRTVLVTGSTLVPDSVVDDIGRRGYEVRLFRRDDLSAGELHDALRGVSGYLIGGRELFGAEHLESARSLAAIGFVGTDAEAYVPGWRPARTCSPPTW